MIEIINLCKSFNGRTVLDKLSLDIRKGETMVVIGRSGIGKSVLLKHIIGIMRPDGGQIFIDSQEIVRMPAKEKRRISSKFGMLFQGAALFDSLTVGENVAFSVLENSNASYEEVRPKILEKLSTVGLDRVEEMKPAELSGGMRKRVGLARALFHDPSIILYDEPTTGLDPINADAVNDLVLALQKQLGVTSVVVTHDMVSAYKIGTRIAMIHQGRIINVGTPDEVRNTQDPVVRQFILGQAHGPLTGG